MTLRAAFAALLLCACASVFADDKDVDEAADAGRAALQEDLAPPAEAIPTVADHVTAAPASPDQVVLADTATRDTYLRAMRGYYEYRTSGYQYRARVFEWQLFSSRIIFCTVVLLVCAGIYFAAVQFHVALAVARRTNSIATESAAPSEGSPLVTHLEISAKGVVVNSSILGVIILVLSLAFFYLYLVYVYPIQDVI
ncbi:MAG: hypothetical protein ABW034_03155 [Steroidobacteraceae bacterium]